LKAINDISSMRDIIRRQVDLLLIRNWLENCEKNHRSCSGRPVNGNDATFPLFLIDVRGKNLVEKTSNVRYFALSYVWGGIDQYKTTTSELAKLKENGSLELIRNQIPGVINDAIRLVKELGEIYLWVDALCIMNDNAQQKHQQIAQMASVYQQASLTIVALGGKDASAGLTGFRPHSRLNEGVEIAPGVLLCSRTRKLSDIISKSTYNTRAWTYQERLLSRRCLFFTEEQVYFQCGTTVVCEDRMDPCPHDHTMVAPLALSIGRQNSAQENRWHITFPYYARFVVDYSRKQLSFHIDVISAFLGISKSLEQLYGWRFAEGL